ncbi:MAG: helix-turn-helix domain-containing protein [Proteobacteria bacterium]|nr:helix-turn-helix domain-containing protein [Pseudomonadota bacterium]
MSPPAQLHDLTVYEERRGRPTNYRPEFCEIVARLAAGGATDFELAQALGCAAGTLYRWRSTHPEFEEATRLGKECADDRVERSLYHRAIGYSYPTVKIMQDKGKPVVVKYIEHVPPDPAAAFMWLRNRKPDEWRDRRELTGPNGGAIQVKSVIEFVDAPADDA